MEHRVASSRQIIASILMLKARAVSSEETRGHLQDAHQRVMSVAAVLKYAFPTDKPGSVVLVTYESEGADWKLVVSDNGVGKDAAPAANPEGGLGTVIVKALVKQLDARMEVLSAPAGLSVEITRASFTSKMPHAA